MIHNIYHCFGGISNILVDCSILSLIFGWCKRNNLDTHLLTITGLYFHAVLPRGEKSKRVMTV